MLIEDKISMITKEEIQKFTLHAKREEDKYRKRAMIGDEEEGNSCVTEIDSSLSEGSTR